MKAYLEKLYCLKHKNIRGDNTNDIILGRYLHHHLDNLSTDTNSFLKNRVFID